MDNAVNAIEAARMWVEIAERLGPTLVAIVAIIITFLAAKHQIRATSVSVSRRQWIDTLRDDLAKVVALQGSTTLKLKLSNIESQELVAELLTMHFRIELLLTPSNSNHSALLDALTIYRSTIVDVENTSSETMRAAIDGVISAGRVVIDEEWSRIKQVTNTAPSRSFEAVGGFDERYFAAEDIVMC